MGVSGYKAVRFPHESTEETGTITLVTFARPDTDLTISSYTKATDTLVLTFTESPDL